MWAERERTAATDLDAPVLTIMFYNPLKAVTELLKLDTKTHIYFSDIIRIERGSTHWLSCNVKIAGKPVSTCWYPSDAALPIPLDAERLVWARRNILYATEMWPWTILEAFAERIVRLGAHRSSWRNGISEGSHKPFCSQPISRRLHILYYSSGSWLPGGRNT